MCYVISKTCFILVDIGQKWSELGQILVTGDSPPPGGLSGFLDSAYQKVLTRLPILVRPGSSRAGAQKLKSAGMRCH